MDIIKIQKVLNSAALALEEAADKFNVSYHNHPGPTQSMPEGSIRRQHAKADKEILHTKANEMTEEAHKVRAFITELSSAPTLFSSGNFILHSGQKSKFKIDCDALTDNDWATLASIAVKQLRPFHSVIGVPTGGLKFAEALKRYTTPGYPDLLIADDVLTTGDSLISWSSKTWMRMREGPYQGVVAFARGPCPKWITPIFNLHQSLRD